MRIAVVGGSGNAGVHTIRALTDRGHDVVAISRSGIGVGGARGASADLVTGVGLTEALDGIDVVVDCVGPSKFIDLRVFTIGTHNLVFAALEAQVQRAVVLSIVGTDKSRFPYHIRKAEQEATYLSSSIQTTIVRSTQFHDLAAAFFAAGAPLGVIPVFLGARLQTLSVPELGAEIARETVEPSGRQIVNVGGPEVLVSRDMAKQWQAATHARGMIVNGPFPPTLLTFFRDGENLLPADGIRTKTTFESWLRSR